MVVGIGCGRIDFAPTADGAISVPPGRIGVLVSSDAQFGAIAAVANAAVLLDDGSRYATDDNGFVLVPAAGPTSLTVVYPLGGGNWRVASALAVPPTSVVELGGRPVVGVTNSMFADLPDAGAFEYGVRVPPRCGFDSEADAASLSIVYSARCEGQTVHAIAFVATVPPQMVDAMVDLASGTTSAVAGPYVAAQTYSLEITNVPAEPAGTVVRSAIAELAPELIYRSDPVDVPADAATVTATPAATPGGNALAIGVVRPNAGAYSSATGRVDAVALAPTTTIDASRMLPQLDNLALAPDLSTIAWTVAAATATPVTAYATEAVFVGPAGDVEWSVYAPDPLTAVRFPTLPADLAAAVPPPTAIWGAVDVSALAYRTQGYAALLVLVDQRLLAWLEFGDVPGDDFAISTTSYNSQLGAP